MVRYITLPCMRGTIAILLIMQIAGMLYVDFDQPIDLSNPAVRQTVDIVDSLIYRKSFSEAVIFG